MVRLIAGVLVLLALAGCGSDLTRSMWNADLPHRQPNRAIVATARVIATPVTVVVDGTSAVGEAVLCSEDFWLCVGDVVYVMLDGCCRVACH